LMRMLDYAFPLAMQIVWLPLFAAKVLGDVIVTVINGALRFLPLSEAKRRQWSRSIRRNWLCSGGRLAIGRSNKLYMMRLKAAWHGCSENAGISRRTPHCS
jgi:hypothetical protein